MRIGIDARPALLSRTGIGRYVTELVAAIGRLVETPEIRLYGDSWRRPLDLAGARRWAAAAGATLHRQPLPGRFARLFAPLGYGVEVRLGAVDLFHHTDLAFAPVRRARTVVTVHDVAFALDPTLHGPDFRRDVPGRLRRELDRAAAVIVPSAETRDRLREQYPGSIAPVFVVPHGGEHLLAAAAAGPESVELSLERLGVRRPFILSVGTIEPRKNHLRLLGAFARVAGRLPHTLVLVGGFGWLCDDVRAELARLLPGGRVVHLRNASDTDLRLLYGQAELAVYPSLYEGFGLPVLEAMVLGAPVLTTRGGALAEVGGDAVRYVDARDEEALAREIERLATDDALRVELSARGSLRAREFTWERSARRHLDVYRAVARG